MERSQICSIVIENMRNYLVLLALVVAIASAEKYAIIVGAAKGWANYPAYGVGDLLLSIFLVCMPKLCRPGSFGI